MTKHNICIQYNILYYGAASIDASFPISLNKNLPTFVQLGNNKMLRVIIFMTVPHLFFDIISTRLQCLPSETWPHGPDSLDQLIDTNSIFILSSRQERFGSSSKKKYK